MQLFSLFVIFPKKIKLLPKKLNDEQMNALENEVKIELQNREAEIHIRPIDDDNDDDAAL